MIGQDGESHNPVVRLRSGDTCRDIRDGDGDGDGNCSNGDDASDSSTSNNHDR